MANNDKNFLVSTADFAFYVNDTLACTGVTNLNTSIEASMQEQSVNAGKGSKLVYSFKYGRELSITLEAADWKLEFIAANVGSPITQGLADVYHIADCIDIVNGIGTLSDTPIGDVAVEMSDGSIVTITPTANTIDLTSKNITNGTVMATYKYSTNTKTVTIGDATPYVGKLVLDADKYSNTLGKTGSVQVVVPAFQLNGNFSISFTPDGVTSTNLDGKALAVTGDKCTDGSSIYAYINEFDDISSVLTVNDIAATPSVVTLMAGDDKTISVIGLKGGMYAPIKLDNANCTFTSDNASVATVGAKDGIIHGVGTGTAMINIDYNNYKDFVQVTVS